MFRTREEIERHEIEWLAPYAEKSSLSRGRDFESQISMDYLAQLNDLYEEWIDNFALCPVLTVPADDMDYVAHPRHLDLIVEKMQAMLTGKEEVVFAPEEVARVR